MVGPLKNWSGYAVTGSGYTTVSGSWRVPSVAATKKNTYSATWVGIDGFSNGSLIQAGTGQDWVGGVAAVFRVVGDPAGAGDPDRFERDLGPPR